MNFFNKRFSDFKIRTKLFLLIGVYLISLIILGAVANILFKSSQTMTILANEERVFSEYFDHGVKYFYQYELSGNKNELKQAIFHFQKATEYASTFASIDSIIREMPREEWINYLFDVYKEGVDNDIGRIEVMGNQVSLFFAINPGRLEEIQNSASEAALHGKNIIRQINQYSTNKTAEELTAIQNSFDKADLLAQQIASQLYKLNDYLNKVLFLTIFSLFLILGIFVIFTTIKVSISISKPINRLVENFKRIAKGNLESSVQIYSKNEIGELSNSFLEIQNGIQNIKSYTQKVARGEYGIKLRPKSEEDELTVALNKMTSKLEEGKLQTEKENWLQNGMSRLDDKMRGNYSVRELSDQIIKYVCNFLDVEMGAVYVFDEVLEHLELTGSLGVDIKSVKEKIQVGEGLVGKSALDKKLQVIETKSKYHKVYSATGEIFPGKVYFLPLHYSNRIQAVIELAPVNELSEIKIEFLILVKERISVNLSAAVARYRSKELLEKTLEQAKILEDREAELEQKLEENMRIQGKLTQESALLDSMLKIIPDSIHFKDSEGKFLRVSKSLLDLFDAKSDDELIGKSDFDFYIKEDARKYYKKEKQIMESGAGFIDKINENIGKNGEQSWTSVTKLPMYDNTGKCIGTFSISKDITYIKKLEIEVKERNEKLESQKEELKAINDQLTQQQEELKETNDELKTQEEELQVANEELAEQTRVLTESEKNLQVQQEELRVTNEELESKTQQLQQQKNEITKKNEDLLKTQNELKKKAKELQQASQYKSEFLANMSHELRTPLNSLLILSKLLGNNKAGNLTPDQLKSINIINKSGKDLLELINEILDLSKIEAGKMKYEFSTVPSQDIVSEIEQHFKPVAENKGLDFEIDRSDQFPEQIHTDKQRLMQIIKNLLSNAFKFTSSGGIKVKMGLPGTKTSFAHHELNRKNTCYIAVEDSGVGIPESKMEAIFEAFQQADGSISRKFGGTGLGLSISKQLTQVLGGEIDVDSTEGNGSVFTIYLPLNEELVRKEAENTPPGKSTSEKAYSAKDAGTSAPPEQEKKQKQEAEIPKFVDDDRDSDSNRLLVLLIHNNKEKAEKLIGLCHKKKFNVVAASGIDYGIKLAEKYAIQAIILSAELSNSEKLKKLKESASTRQLPVHVVSRIEDSVIENIEELTTPESEGFQDVSNSIESKISKEYKQVLVVEDDPITRESIQLLFENKDIIIHEANNAQQAYDLISTKPFDCVILDLGLPDYSGNVLLKQLKDDDIPLPNVIIHTARELSQKELHELQKYSDSIVIKGVKSDERLMDEVTLFLHQVENSVPKTYSVSPDESGNSNFAGKKALVVDDDIRNVFAVAQILEERDVEVLEAENGQVALDVLKNNPNIDLVLMDIMMPVMDGYEAISIIRKTPGIKSVPIITLTAKAMKEDYQKAIDSGANDYISKPVDVDKLLSLLKIWLFK